MRLFLLLFVLLQLAPLATSSESKLSGTIQVTTNYQSASFTLRGPVTISHTGQAITLIDIPPGEYTITYGPECLAGIPPAETKSLPAGSAITFSGEYTPGFLSFPLKGAGPCTAQMNAVFDHSQRTPYVSDGRVVNYRGEEGAVNPRNPHQRFMIRVNNSSLYGFRNATGTPFLLNGSNSSTKGLECRALGVGGSSDANDLPCETFMLYDGHPGIDYSAPCGIEVYAVAAGTVRYPRQSRPGIADPYRFHVLELELDEPRGYKVYYLHLATHPSIKPGEEVFFCKMPPLVKEGQHVEEGELIGRTGDAGAPPHLHFEVHFNGVPVDPYGWKGNGQDPYELTRKVKNINLWK